MHASIRSIFLCLVFVPKITVCMHATWSREWTLYTLGQSQDPNTSINPKQPVQAQRNRFARKGKELISIQTVNFSNLKVLEKV